MPDVEHKTLNAGTAFKPNFRRIPIITKFVFKTEKKELDQ